MTCIFNSIMRTKLRFIFLDFNIYIDLVASNYFKNISTNIKIVYIRILYKLYTNTDKWSDKDFDKTETNMHIYLCTKEWKNINEKTHTYQIQI